MKTYSFIIAIVSFLFLRPITIHGFSFGLIGSPRIMKRLQIVKMMGKPSRPVHVPIPRKVKDGCVEVDGKVVEALPDATFKVILDNTKDAVLAKLCGKMRKGFIKVMIGDKVKMEMTPYDLTRGRITFRVRG
mmetsp:Transcript_47519/g.61023  ORF Transcript_47519/g.61023 Transcript_47519/m.61023 type:complete len:132 (-) Transcript_47519:143-538(-)